MSFPDVSAGSDMLLGLLHMPSLVSTRAADSPVLFSGVTALAAAYGQQIPTAASSGTGDSHMDTLHADAAAAQPTEPAGNMTTAATGVASNPGQKTGKPTKGPVKKKCGAKKQQMVCKVDGCGAHLSQTKAYYQRHKVCAVHLSAMSAPVNGVSSRFCQQCGKFQPLEEFDADKRSCRARLKRHNNRRREQRHNRTFDFNLAVRCQTAALLAATEDEEGAAFEDFYTQQGLPADLAAGHYPQQQQQQQRKQPYQASQLIANLLHADSPTAAAAAVAVAAAAAAREGRVPHPQGDALPSKQRRQAAKGASPKHSKQGTTGDGSSIAGGASEGTTATAAGVTDGSPGISPSAAAAAAAAAAPAATAATAAAGAVGTPTSRRPLMRRVSASRALEAMRAINASSYSTESTDWEDESEDGRSTHGSAAWLQQRRQQHLAAGAGASKLPGSRLRATDCLVAQMGFEQAAAAVAAAAAAALQADPHQQRSAGCSSIPQVPSQALLGQGAGGGIGFNGGMHTQSPEEAEEGMQQHWAAAEYDLQGWEASLTSHLQAQQQQQQQNWGSAYDGSCGGGLAASVGGADGSHAQYGSQAGAAAVVSAGGASARHPEHLQHHLTLQHSAPAGAMSFSRSNSPALYVGPSSFNAAAAAAGPGAPSRLVHSVSEAGAAAGAPCHQLLHTLSLPVLDGAAGAQELFGGSMQYMQQQQQQLAPHDGVHEAMLPTAEDTGCCDDYELDPATAQVLHDALASLLPGAAAAAGTARVPVEPELAAPFQVHVGGSSPPRGSNSPPGSSTGHDGQRPLSPRASVTAAAAAAAMAGSSAAAAGGPVPYGSMLQAGLPGGAPYGHGALCMQQQQQGMSVLHECLAGGAAGGGLMAAAAAGAASAGSPGDDAAGFGAAAGFSGDPAASGSALLQSQGCAAASGVLQGASSVLREELAGVHLGTDCWQQQQQQQVHGVDAHMADAIDPALLLPQLQPHSAVVQPALLQPEALPAGQLQLCAQQPAQQRLHSPGQTSPTGEFDSVDTAAAAATFEAQLAACCGDRDSQQAVFKAWLDALLPQAQQQQQQQQLTPQQQQQQQRQQQHAQAAMACMQQQQAVQDMHCMEVLEEQQQQLAFGSGPSPSPPPGFREVQKEYQEQQAGSAGRVGSGAVDDEDVPPGFMDDLDDVDADLDAAAAALQLAAQKVLAGEGCSDEGGNGAGISPEEDFAELLDLLLGA